MTMEYIEWNGRDVPEGIDPDNPPKEVQYKSVFGYVNRDSNNAGTRLVRFVKYRINAAILRPEPVEPLQTPQPGQWWEMEPKDADPVSRIGYCVGADASGDLVWQDHSGTIDWSQHDLAFFLHQPIRHLPYCTGFDYEIPSAEDGPVVPELSTPQPGEWWEWQDGNEKELFVLYCCGANYTGERIWNEKDGEPSRESQFFGRPIHHLPDCIGFDYELPAAEPEPDPKYVYWYGHDVPANVPGLLPQSLEVKFSRDWLKSSERGRRVDKKNLSRAANYRCLASDCIAPFEPEPEPVLPEGRCKFAGAGWYRFVGGKCVELDEGRLCAEGAGLISDEGEGGGGVDGNWEWEADGTIEGVTPANGEPIEDWFLAEKLDGPPPELPETHEHLHPPEFRLPKNGELYWHLAGVTEAGFDHDFPAARKWIVRKPEPATKTVTLSRWLYYYADQWRVSDYRERQPNFRRVILHDSMEVEVPCDAS